MSYNQGQQNRYQPPPPPSSTSSGGRYIPSMYTDYGGEVRQPAPAAGRGYPGPPSSTTSSGPRTPVAMSPVPMQGPGGVRFAPGPPPGGPPAPYNAHPLQGPPSHVGPPSHTMDVYMPPPGGMPAAFLNRKRTVRNIPLTPQGNLVIDVPVPDRVLGVGKFRTGEEFTHMRYTAATCTADEFPSRGYSLRQQEYGRQTELFIVVTMYNEDDYLFCKSMAAIMRNIAHLCTRTRSRTWGTEGWKKVIICIVSDGRAKVNPRVLDVLGLMGVYQDGIMKDHVNGKPVSAHIFEYTTQVCVDEELKVKGHDKGIVPVQILFCLKEKNAKKINSHRWFFNAFGPLLRPNVCLLIDVGTKPASTALYHLWKAFDANPRVGGACGEIYAELGTGCSNLLNPLVAAQNFEYKMSNILDKPLESVFGFISVLPGAFSAYRYVALQGTPLAQYFKGETLHGGADIFAANMYLAEDRILCFELATKRNQPWTLKYVKSAKAETDVPDSVPEFISQRRRWLNGSFFAAVHALTHWYFIFRSGHSILRKMALLFLFFYNFVQLVFSWFGMAFFYLTFYFMMNFKIVAQNTNVKDAFGGYQQTTFEVMRQVYFMAIIITFICSLGNRPQGSRWIYTTNMVIFALIMGVLLYLGGYNIFYAIPHTTREWSNIGSLILTRPALRDIVLSLASTYFLYIVSSIMFFEPWHMVTSFVQYLFLMPSFINILNVYAFCNLHDVTWGTKGDNGTATDLGAVTATKNKDGKQVVEVEVPTERNDINANYEKFLAQLAQPRPTGDKHRDSKTKQEDYFRNFRTKVVLGWAFSNALVVVVLSNDKLSEVIYRNLNVDAEGGFNPFLRFIFYSVLALSTVRFFGAVSYLIMRLICG